MPLIKVENLVKDFKRQKRKEGFWGAVQGLVHREYEIKTAVDHINFEVDKGEIVGYIGPNGAGKSTTIKMLVGILVPSSGHIKVNGLEPYKNRIENAKRIGVVFGQRTQLWWDTPVSESFNLMKYMFKIPEDTYRANLKLFSEILGLDEFINVAVRQLSLGQRMRADLCAALLHNPEILYLDEPTIGLDVVVKENIREFIKEINQRTQTTVILTTHDMSDIEKLCSRVMVIDQGRIMYDGALDNLKNIYGTEEVLTVEVEGFIKEMNGLKNLGVSDVNIEGNKAIVKYDKKSINSTRLIGWLMERYTLKDFLVKETEIEEVIRKMYKDLQKDSEECLIK